MRQLVLGAAALAISIGGCSVDIPDGVFACSSDTGCPDDFVCRCDSLSGTHACSFGCPATWPCMIGRCFRLQPGPCDSDGDGHFANACDGLDCGDFDVDVAPGAPETLGGGDEDCDGRIDEAAGEICEDGLDNDSDFRIDEGCPELCGDGRDNDGDGSVDEGCPAPEVCDGLDNDFDGRIDEGATAPRILEPVGATPRWVHPAEIPGGLAITYDRGDRLAGLAIVDEDGLALRESPIPYAMTAGDRFDAVPLLPFGCPVPIADLPPPPVEPPVGVVPGVTCEAHADCDDGDLCNGYETCAPGLAGADARGCLPAPEGMDACLPVGGVCDGRLNRCVRGDPGACNMADLAVALGGDGAFLGVAIDDLVCSGGTVRVGWLTSRPGNPEIGDPGRSLLLRGDLARSTSYLGVDAADGSCTGASRGPGIERGATSPAIAVLDGMPPQALAAWLAAPLCRSDGSCPADEPVRVELLGLWLEEDATGIIRWVSATGDAVPRFLTAAIGAAPPAVVAWPGGSSYFVAYPTALGIALRRIPAFAAPSDAPVPGRRRTSATIADIGSATIIEEPGFRAAAIAMAIDRPQAIDEVRLGLTWISGDRVAFRAVTQTVAGLVAGPTIAVGGLAARTPSITSAGSTGQWQVTWTESGRVQTVRVDSIGVTTGLVALGGMAASFPHAFVGADGVLRVVYHEAVDGALVMAEQCAPIAGGVTDPCAMPMSGLARDCGWTIVGDFPCVSGFPMTIGCNESCMPPIGACTGDAMIRVCDGPGNVCIGARALGASDDACSTLCPMVMTSCPMSGVVTVLTAPFGAGPTSCDVVVQQDFVGP